MAGVAALIGIPLFFEVGVVLLVPIVLLVARRSSRSVLSVGIPALAGLSVLHGLVPPPGAAGRHQRPERRPRPDPLFGLIAAVPCVVLAGPVFGQWISRRLDLPARRSLFFSHVNDAGFWLVKEYFGMTVGHTITSWSVMETIISVVGLLAVLALSVVV
jgi:H+/gluconate symporter-like permease